MKTARNITSSSHLVDIALPAGHSENPWSDKHTGRNPGFDRVLIEDLLLEDVVLEDVVLEDVVLEDVVLEDVVLEDVY